jgi:hypothetical protein
VVFGEDFLAHLSHYVVPLDLSKTAHRSAFAVGVEILIANRDGQFVTGNPDRHYGLVFLIKN